METSKNELLIPSSIVENLSAMVRNELAKMDAQKQAEFIDEYNRKSKSVGASYAFQFLFGSHYAYLNNWGMQIVFWLTFGGLLWWWFIDLFRQSRMVESYNKDVATNILRDMKLIAA